MGALLQVLFFCVVSPLGGLHDFAWHLYMAGVVVDERTGCRAAAAAWTVRAAAPAARVLLTRDHVLRSINSFSPCLPALALAALCCINASSTMAVSTCKAGLDPED